MEITDTHAHLDLPEFEQDMLQVIERAGEAGVGKIICVGTTVQSSRKCIELAGRFPGRIYASVGIHPNYCAQAEPDDFKQIEALAQLAEVVAIGETGLDFHHDYASPELQASYFRNHVELSLSAGKPVIIHARNADKEAVDILRGISRSLHGLRHCFDGSAQDAAPYIELGMHISFGGIVTRPGHKKLKAAAHLVPDDRLLVETDCPYMTPAEAQGGRNEPAFILHTVKALAALRNAEPAKIAALTTRNAERLFFGGR